MFSIFLQTDKFGMFIVLPMHKESLRTMIEKGLVNGDIKIRVLEMLKPTVCNTPRAPMVPMAPWSHGDIKDIFELFFLRI